MLATVENEKDVVYPVSDGKPLAETGIHAEELMALYSVLRLYFEDRPDVLVQINNFMYYEEGKPSSCFSPDLYVVFGIPKLPFRDCYKIWEEGRAPNFILEATSKSTRGEDQGKKKDLCARLGVQEYFMFDPRNEYLKPALQGHTLKKGVYVPLVPDADGRIFSTVLNLKFYAVSGTLRMIEPNATKPLPRLWEYKRIAEREAEAHRREAEARQHEAEARRREAEARRAAEAEVERLKAELKRLKGGKN